MTQAEYSEKVYELGKRLKAGEITVGGQLREIRKLNDEVENTPLIDMQYGYTQQVKLLKRVKQIIGTDDEK
jgi:hypothetical protein